MVSLLGTLNWATQSVDHEPALVRYRNLQAVYTHQSKLAWSDLAASVSLLREAKSDLFCWINRAKKKQRRYTVFPSLFRHTRSLHLVWREENWFACSVFIDLINFSSRRIIIQQLSTEDGKLLTSAFTKFRQVWHTKVDLLVSSGNTQLPIFVSWVTEALTLDGIFNMFSPSHVQSHLRSPLKTNQGTDNHPFFHPTLAHAVVVPDTAGVVGGCSLNVLTGTGSVDIFVGGIPSTDS